MQMNIAQLFIFVVLLVLNVSSNALVIDIVDGNDSPIAIANVPFANNEGKTTDIASIVDSNLKRSGAFSVLSRTYMLSKPQRASEIDFADWRSRATEYVVIGRVKRQGNLNRVEYELYNVITKQRLLSNAITGSPNQMRRIAHRISDSIYKKLTGLDGIFSSSIAYVSTRKVGAKQFSYYLVKADSDGENSKILLESSEPILSPSWSPDSTRLAYVSFENGKPEIFMQNVSDGRRTRLTSYPGLNGAPSWSPDGRKLAMVLSKDGNPEIYVMDIASRRLQRVTRNTYSIDTEPSWYPDSRHLVITSDRGGRPQLYRLDTASGQVKRLTFNGSYNARGRVLPNGQGVIMVHGGGRGYRIAYQDFSSGELRILSDTSSDESPSIAPNSGMVMYATQRGRSGALAVVSINGRSRYFLPARTRDIREPAWSKK